MATTKPVLSMRFDQLKIFTCNANPVLAAKICASLGCALGKASVNRFSDGETDLQIEENVRGADIFVVQPTSTPVDQNIMELLLMIDAAKRASAQRITAVLPYYGYARQDRKDRPRKPISARLVANLIQRAGADRVLTLDLHAAQIQGFFDVPVDHLFASPVFIEYFDSMGSRNYTVVSPDAGGVERARAFAKRLDAPLAIIDKRRTDVNVAEVMHIIGEVEGRTCAIMDDMVDTANTLCHAAQALRDRGAQKVLAYCTHPVLSGPAVERINNSVLDEVVVTDTIPLSPEAEACRKIRQLSCAALLGETISRISREDSVSSLFIE